MKFEESVGAVVFHDKEFLLLRDGSGYWGFPKGHIETGEDMMTALKREVEEETGIKGCELIPGFKEEIGYYFHKGNTIVSKKVTYFLMKAPNKNAVISHEHTAFEWLPIKKATERVPFENSKSLLRKAAEFLKIQ